SPGTNSCSFTKFPAPTEIEALVLAVLLASVMSLAVRVRMPAVLRVTLKLWVPPTRAVSGGKVALASEELISTVSVTLAIKFQLASTALTVTLNGALATWVMGVPVLPVAVPGVAVSPGTRICSLVKAPALAVMVGLVFAVLVPSVTLLAVTVQLPAVLKVTVKFLVPEAKALFAGCMSFGSVVVMLIVFAGAELTTFQFESTALTVTVKPLPAA